MEFLSDFGPVWEALGSKSGRDYVRKRARATAIRRQRRINVVEQSAARRLFVFRSIVRDPGPAAKAKAAQKRVLQLGRKVLPHAGTRLVARLRGAILRGGGPGDPQFEALADRLNGNYFRLQAGFERIEAVERADLEQLADRIAADFREEALGSESGLLGRMEDVAAQLREADLEQVAVDEHFDPV